jgi:hypothetical protein
MCFVGVQGQRAAATKRGLLPSSTVSQEISCLEIAFDLVFTRMSPPSQAFSGFYRSP